MRALLRELGASAARTRRRARWSPARAAARITPRPTRKYLIEAHTQALTSSAAPSVSSIYDASTDLRGVLFIAISQSGKSPDLLAATQNAQRRRRVVPSRCATRRIRR